MAELSPNSDLSGGRKMTIGSAASSLEDSDDRKSAFIQGLAESQGTVAVICALLAGFGFSGLCCVTLDEMQQSGALLQYTFVISTSLSGSIALFVTLVCSLAEQQGRVARSFAVLRRFEPDFEDALHSWWKSFAQARTNALLMLIYIVIPVFFVSMGSIALIKFPVGPGLVSVSIFLVVGAMAYKQILDVNHLFRDSVLRFFTSAEAFAAPCLDPEPTPGTVHHRAAKSLIRSLTGNSMTTPPQEDEDEGFTSPDATGQDLPDHESEMSDVDMSSPATEGNVDEKLDSADKEEQGRRTSTRNKTSVHDDDVRDDPSPARPPRRRCVTLHPGAEVQILQDPADSSSPRRFSQTVRRRSSGILARENAAAML